MELIQQERQDHQQGFQKEKLKIHTFMLTKFELGTVVRHPLPSGHAQDQHADW
jgi:aspartate carbamoyltransferase catalytic subunit